MRLMFLIQVNRSILRSFFDIYFLADGSGMISQKELGSVFKALNIPINESQLKKLVKDMDTDHSGRKCSKRSKMMFFISVIRTN